jgi:hypothetical protein
MDLLRRWVLHNLPLKLLALASAVLLWSAVAEEPRTEVAHSVPIEFINVPAGFTIVSEKAPDVQIWLAGPRRMVREIGPGDLHPVIDLLGLARGRETTYRLATSQIKATKGVDVVEVVPSEFHLSMQDSTVHVSVAAPAPKTSANPAGNK